MIKSFSLYLLLAVLIMAGCSKDDLGHNPSQPMTIESFTPEEGGGGTSILITGTNFSGDTSQLEVLINGNKLAIVGANTKQIMAVVPKKCGSGTITVKVGTNTVTSTDVFTYRFTRTVSTLAGNATAGYANGKGENASFNFSGANWYRSQGIAVDDNLNVYVADPGNHCIRKIDSAGNVTLVAGNPNVGGYADGQGTDANFWYPYDITLDKAGNMYTIDPINWDIRKITQDGTATTIGFASQEPWSIAFDKKTDQLFYSGCVGSANIYKMEDGNSTAIVQGLVYPAGFDFDKDGNMFVTGHGDNVIYKFDAGTWARSVIAGQMGVGGYLNGIGTAAKFSLPWSLSVDQNGNIYVATNGRSDGGTNNPDQSIRFIEPGTWKVSTYAGSGTAGYSNGIGEAAAFSAPTGVAVDKNGTVYVLDKNNNRVRKIVSE
jgi:hypothetical protein